MKLPRHGYGDLAGHLLSQFWIYDFKLLEAQKYSSYFIICHTHLTIGVFGESREKDVTICYWLSRGMKDLRKSPRPLKQIKVCLHAASPSKKFHQNWDSAINKWLNRPSVYTEKSFICGDSLVVATYG